MRLVTASSQSSFTIPWAQDGARQIEVVIDAHLPPHSPTEKRIRGIAEIATSHGALRVLLESAFADQWSVGVLDAESGVTTVHMAPLEKISAQATSRGRGRA